MTSSIPNSDFLNNGFPYAPLEANRTVDFALEYWHLKRDVYDKDAAISKLKAQLRDCRLIERKSSDTIHKLKLEVASRDETIINMEARLLLAQEAIEREKQNTTIKGKASARGRLIINKLEAQLSKRAEEVKELEAKVSQLKTALQVERDEAAKNIRSLEERNLQLSVSLREVSEAEEHSVRTIQELQAERDGTRRSMDLGSTSSSLRISPNSSSTGPQEVPQGFVPQADFDALDEAYRELHSRLEQVWAERDEALEKLDLISGESPNE